MQPPLTDEQFWEMWKGEAEEFIGIPNEELIEKKEEIYNDFIGIELAAAINNDIHKLPQYQGDKQQLVYKTMMSAIETFFDAAFEIEPDQVAELFLQQYREKEEMFGDMTEEEIENLMGLNHMQEEEEE